MRKIVVSLTAASALVLFLSACGMGLEPAKTDTTSVSLSFTVATPLASAGSTDAGRAIIPDGGYLYVRMVGGPTADTPRYLGPFQVTGASPTVSITEIPAGQYDGMFLLYADREVHNEEVEIGDIDGNPITVSLGDILSFPDDQFVAFVMDDDEEEYVEDPDTEPVAEEGIFEPHPVDVLLAGRASIGMVESPEVVEGAANSFPVTMEPVTPYWIPIWYTGIAEAWTLEGMLENFGVSGYESFKGFMGIEGLQEYISSYYPEYTGDVTLSFSNESTTESMTVNSLSVYNAEGLLLATPPVPFPVTMNAGQEYSLDVPMPEPDLDEIFFYLDVSGGTPALTISLDGVEIEEPIQMDDITGSLNLADYMSNFDTVDSVMFSTTTAVSLADLSAWDPESEAPPEGIVGGGDLTANPTVAGTYNFENASIASVYADTALYLIVVGEKYGQPVLYASTGSYQASEMSGLAPAMNPLIQYVVVYSQNDGQGLASYNQMPAQLTIMQGNTPVAQSLSTVQYSEYIDLMGYYIAVLPLYDTNGATVIFPAGTSLDLIFEIPNPLDPENPLYYNAGTETSLGEVFITVVFDLT